jgi:diguanylate cyclase (GGDEF)-like protein
MGVVTAAVTAACVIKALLCMRGRYSLAVNTYGVCTLGTFAVTCAMFKFGAGGSYWPILLVVAFYFVLPEKRARLFNVLAIGITVPSAWMTLDPDSAVRFAAVLVGVSLFAASSMREVNILYALVRRQAVRDSLTGLFNRSLLEEWVQQAIARSERMGIPMVLLSFDVDDFKRINDTHGHQAGDHVLERLGDVFLRNTRRSDPCFRTGGEEFLVLVHDADERIGAELAEKLRCEVERAAIVPDLAVTLSAGVAGLGQGMSSADWLKCCDEKLYRAKRSGRNQVVA